MALSEKSVDLFFGMGDYSRLERYFYGKFSIQPTQCFAQGNIKGLKGCIMIWGNKMEFENGIFVSNLQKPWQNSLTITLHCLFSGKIHRIPGRRTTYFPHFFPDSIRSSLVLANNLFSLFLINA